MSDMTAKKRPVIVAVAIAVVAVVAGLGVWGWSVQTAHAALVSEWESEAQRTAVALAEAHEVIGVGEDLAVEIEDSEPTVAGGLALEEGLADLKASVQEVLAIAPELEGTQSGEPPLARRVTQEGVEALAGAVERLQSETVAVERTVDAVEVQWADYQTDLESQVELLGESMAAAETLVSEAQATIEAATTDVQTLRDGVDAVTDLRVEAQKVVDGKPTLVEVETLNENLKTAVEELETTLGAAKDAEAAAAATASASSSANRAKGQASRGSNGVSDNRDASTPRQPSPPAPVQPAPQPVPEPTSPSGGGLKPPVDNGFQGGRLCNSSTGETWVPKPGQSCLDGP